MRTESGTRQPAPTRRRTPPRDTRRWMRLAVVGALAVVLGVFVTVPLLAARDAQADLLAGQAHLEDARDALTAADVRAAHASFAAAAERIAEGRARLDSPALRVGGALPVLGDNVTAARELARAARHVADAGLTAAGAVAELPGGLAAFAPRDGALPLEPLQRLAGPLAEAAQDLAAAEEAVAAAPERRLLGPVARAREQAATQVADASRAVRTGAALAAELPAFLGAEGPRRYFVGAQNPAELRGTGGLIGAFGILTADQGRIHISEFRNIGELTRAAPDDLPPPTEEYAARYGVFSAATHGSNINMTPDVPTAATAIETLYETVTGEAVDGTILTDPLFLKAILEVVGPTEVPEIGTIDAEGVVRFVTQEQYDVFEGPSDERKEALGEIAGAVLRRFLAHGPPDPALAVAVFGDAAAGGHLLLHARDDEVQAAFAEAGIHGAIADVEGDYLAVIGNNAAGNKVDAFLEQEITYDVELLPDGAARGHLTIDLTNTAPTEGLHRSVIGPYEEGYAPGENRTYWSVYCPATCELERFERGGQPEPLSPQREFGRRVFATNVRLASGESQQLSFEWTVADAWRPTTGGGVYSLVVDGQPELLASSTMTLRARAPEDARVTATAPPIDVAGRQSVWSAEPVDGSYTVRFQHGGGVASRIKSVLNRPLLSLVAGS